MDGWIELRINGRVAGCFYDKPRDCYLFRSLAGSPVFAVRGSALRQEGATDGRIEAWVRAAERQPNRWVSEAMVPIFEESASRRSARFGVMRAR